MAQTTGATSSRNVVLEFSTNGSSWTDGSGYTNLITPSGGDRMVGEAQTFDGDTTLLTAGKREPYKVKVRAIYTETSSELAVVARTAQQAGTALYLRWSKNSTVGTLRYTTSAGFVTTGGGVIPAFDTTNGDPVRLEFELICSEITPAAIS